MTVSLSIYSHYLCPRLYYHFNTGLILIFIVIFFSRNEQYVVIASEYKMWIFEYDKIKHHQGYIRGDIDCSQFPIEIVSTNQNIVGLFST